MKVYKEADGSRQCEQGYCRLMVATVCLFLMTGTRKKGSPLTIFATCAHTHTLIYIFYIFI